MGEGGALGEPVEDVEGLPPASEGEGDAEASDGVALPLAVAPLRVGVPE